MWLREEKEAAFTYNLLLRFLKFNLFYTISLNFGSEEWEPGSEACKR